jgi:hypothetical protein
LDEESAIAFALVLWEGEDTSHVVAFCGLLFLGEVADQMVAVISAGGHAVEEERVDIVVESLVIEEEFGEEAEVTTPGSLPPAVDFEEGYVVVTVDFVPGWVEEGALFPMPCELEVAAKV